MIQELLPDIPRWYTALAEWGACLVYVLLVRRRLTPPMAATFAVGLPALLGIHFLAGNLPLVLWVPGMIAAAATMFAIIQFSVGGNWHNSLYLTARAFVLAELMASFEWQIRSYLVEQAGRVVELYDLILLALTYAVVLLGAFLLERKQFPRDLPLRADTRNAMGAVAIAASTVMIANLSFVTVDTPFSSRFGPEIFYIRTLVDLAGYAALYAHHGARIELQRTVEIEAMNRLVHSQHQQYLQTRRSMDVVNSKYHDLKHYISAIRAEPDPQLRADYLDQLEASVREYDRHIHSGNPVLDAILTQSAQRCADASITFTCVADGEAVDFLDAISLSSLVSNALDNAIEAVSGIEDPEQRLIRVAIYRQGNFAMLLFENYFEGDVAFHEDLPVSSKRDRLNHGFGTRNMRQVVRDWSGSITLEALDGWFVVRALIPIPHRPAGPELAPGSESAPLPQS